MAIGSIPASTSPDRLEVLLSQAASGRTSWSSSLAWVVVFVILAWAWQGAEMRPLDLIRDADNMRVYAREFFPPNFHDWRIYLHEMVITLHIALWGTVLAIVAAIPLGLLSAHNVAPPWVHQPVRRLMDHGRASHFFRPPSGEFDAETLAAADDATEPRPHGGGARVERRADPRR